MRPQVQTVRRKVLKAGLRTMGIWATSLCNFLVLSGPAWAQSCRCHFHLMIECCCACPTLWLGGPDHLVHDGQRRSHGNLVAVVKYSVFTKAQQCQELFLRRRVVIGRRQQGFASEYQGSVLSFTYGGLPRAPNIILVCTDASSTFASAGSSGSRGRATCTAAWTWCRAFSCPGLHSELANFQATQ